MSAFRSMGCDVVVADGVPLDRVRPLFGERDRVNDETGRRMRSNRCRNEPLHPLDRSQ